MAERKRSTPAQSETRPADIPGAPPGELPRLGYLLKTAQLRFMAQTSAALAPLGVDTRQWAALACLGDERHLSQGEIAVLLGVDRTTMVAMLDELEGKGLVSRQPHPEDRRKNEVTLTVAGRRVLAQGGDRLDVCEAEFLARLDESEARSLKRALAALVARPS